MPKKMPKNILISYVNAATLDLIRSGFSHFRDFQGHNRTTHQISAQSDNLERLNIKFSRPVFLEGVDFVHALADILL